MKKKIMIHITTITILVIFSVLFFACVTGPSNNPYPLDGTTWVFVNKDDNEKQYTLSFTTDIVTFTIFNKDGSIDQEPIHGTYTLFDNIITEVFDDYTITSTYSGRRITDSIDTKMIFVKKRNV